MVEQHSHLLRWKHWERTQLGSGSVGGHPEFSFRHVGFEVPLRYLSVEITKVNGYMGLEYREV